MAINFSDDPKSKIIAALMKRGNKPYKPKPDPKSKLVVKPKKDRIYIGLKADF